MQSYDWQSALQQAVRKNQRDAHNRYAQLATVRADGTPANRTVVYRGVSDDQRSLRMVTDLRSDKLTEIAAQPIAELCWYLSHTREQFRIRGRMIAETQSAQRDATWKALSDAAKAQFFWPTPGIAVGSASSSTASSHPADPATEPPPDDFVLLLLEPFYVDHLRLRGTPQTRFFSQLNNNVWESTAVNP